MTLEDMTQEEMLSFLMPFGINQGRALGDIPIDYLKYLKNCNRESEGVLFDILFYFEDEIDEATKSYHPKLRDVL